MLLKLLFRHTGVCRAGPLCSLLVSADLLPAVPCVEYPRRSGRDRPRLCGQLYPFITAVHCATELIQLFPAPMASE